MRTFIYILYYDSLKRVKLAPSPPSFRLCLLFALVFSLSLPSAFAVETAFLSPTAEAADTGGNGDGFEGNSTYAFADDGAVAINLDGRNDRHRFSSYGLSLPPTAIALGIEVRLDAWADSVFKATDRSRLS